jgi:hypothetical protein
MRAQTNRPFEEALAIRDERRSVAKLRPTPQPGKGRPPLRACPSDFDVVFVEVGRVDCETFYRAARITIDRWLLERGKERLIKERAAYVEHQRKLARERDRVKLEQRPRAIVDFRQVSLCVARAAAHFLRANRNGGWIISRRLEGDWIVGTMRKSSAQMLDMALSKGFDMEAAEAFCSVERDD